MTLWPKILIGVAAGAIASGADIRDKLGLVGPNSWQKRQTLAICERADPTFVPFIASEQNNCFNRMRNASRLRH